MPRRQFEWERKKTASDLVIRSNLPQWITAALRQNGIKRMSLLSTLTDEQLLKIPGIGNRAIAMIRTELRQLSMRHDQPSEQSPQPTSTKRLGV
jgi:DNA-directed RNA polymerase alpha subunit